MLTEPQQKYRPFQPVELAGRTWPDQTLTQAPIWLSTDLRDGNQALFEPMNAERKMQLFRMLLRIGFKEIEVAFPSASQTDFDFVRHLIEGGHIPDGVTISVLTHGREPLIRRTMEALRGAKRAIVHLVNPTAPVFRRTVFGLDRAGVTDIAVGSARLIRDLAAEQPETDWMFEYSPETFTATEMDFARDICDAVTEVWQPTPARKVIVNLPATVEITTPNRFADQIEWMHRNLARRDGIILSVHPHNDRGTAVAAAEQALLAGAERVEGTLFGNGERTGNVDLVTLALNLYSQGVPPGLDFSDINAVARLTEDCTRLPVPARHPYAGDMVFTAFSGSHQDAIRKGMAARRPDAVWEVPYLPVDPADLGRSYDALIRVNSQSGKGGIAYLLETEYGIALPRRLQVEFSAAVQQVADGTGREISPADILGLFERDYLHCDHPLSWRGYRLVEDGADQGILVDLILSGEAVTLRGRGNGPIDALLDALRPRASLHAYEERGLGAGGGATAIAFAEIAAEGGTGPVHGVGMDANLVTASLQAVISGLNRAYARLDEDRRRHFFDPVRAG